MILAVIAAGLVVEAMQGVFTADRRPELADWLAEVVGRGRVRDHRCTVRCSHDRPHRRPEDVNV